MGAAQNPITVESSPESVDLREPVVPKWRPIRGIDLLAEVHRVSMELVEEDRAGSQPNKEEDGRGEEEEEVEEEEEEEEEEHVEWLLGEAHDGPRTRAKESAEWPPDF